MRTPFLIELFSFVSQTATKSQAKDCGMHREAQEQLKNQPNKG